jgi:geranylgeranyl pyrophosphate synthase
MNYQFYELITSKLKDWPSPLKDAVFEALSSGGKKLRPRLLHAAAEDLGTPSAVWTPMAAALEVVHTFSLIHDDLPELDNDDWRRGRWTTHRRFGHANALLAGDAAFALAFELFLDALPWLRPDRGTAALRYFCKQVGGSGLIGGQALEIASLGPNMTTKAEIDRLKTGALFELAFTLPARVDPQEDTQSFVPALSRAGFLFGEIYQALDDREDGHPTSGKETESLAAFRDVLSVWLKRFPQSELLKTALSILAPIK